MATTRFTMPTVDELANTMASDADDHYRFSKATRKEVAHTAVKEILRDLVPLVPLLLDTHEQVQLPLATRTHLGELLDTLRVKTL